MLHHMIDSTAYMAHGYCLLWLPWLVALHAGSDLVIFLAYSAIPVAIAIFLHRRKELQLRPLAILFAVFILLCGMTHLIQAITLWAPIYELQGWVKLATAAVSAVTAAVIFPLIPKALAIPSPAQLQATNAGLEREIASHRETFQTLERAQETLVEHARELAAAKARFGKLVEASAEIVWTTNTEGRTEEDSPSWRAFTGQSLEEYLGWGWLAAIHPEDRERVTAIWLGAVASRSMFAAEYRLRRAGGGWRWTAARGAPLFDETGVLLEWVGMNSDITERKTAEETQHRLNRELRAINSCNQALLRAEDEQSLLSAICRIICEEAGYRMVFVASAETGEANAVRPVAWAGAGAGGLAEAGLAWADVEQGRCPVGEAVRTGESSCAQDFAASPEAGPLGENALALGCRSCIAVPLKDESARTFAVLAIYSAKENAFPLTETRLMEELAANLAFGVMALRNRVQRKRAEDALSESELMYRSLFNTMGEGVVVQDSKGEIVTLNRAAGKILGQPGGEGPPPSPGQSKMQFPIGLIALSTGLPQFDVVTGHVKADGSFIWISVNSLPLTCAGETKPHGVVTTFHDITALKQAEEERLAYLRFLENLDRINRAIQGANVIETMTGDALDELVRVFDCDRAWLVSPCDPEAPVHGAVLGASMERVRPGLVPEPPGRRDIPMNGAFASMARALLEVEGAAAFGEDFDYPTPRPLAEGLGVLSCLAMSLYPKVGKSWLLGLVQCSHRRVWTAGEKSLLQEAGRRLEDGITSLLSYRNLQDSESKYREVFDNVSDMLFLIDVVDAGELRYVDMNRVAEKMCGLSKAAIEGKIVGETEGPAIVRRLLPRLRQCAAAGIPVACEEEYALAAGVRILDTVVLPVRNGDGELHRLIVFNRDITERKRSEEEIAKLNRELQQRLKALEEATEELETFSYSVSHDLKIPLRAIDGYICMLREEYGGQLAGEGERYLDVARRNIVKMHRLIEGLLDFIGLSQREMRVGPADMAGLAWEVFEKLRAAEPPERDIRLDVGDLPPAHCDKDMICQALKNLFDNALKFTAPRAETRIEAGGLVRDGENEYFIRDNGVGFDMKYTDKLFGVFLRLHGPEEFEGPGVGLAIVKRIISRHGGRVWAESKEGEGATFHFTLPQAG